jgi:hypothetical protein
MVKDMKNAGVMYSRSVGSDGNYIGSEIFGREICRLTTDDADLLRLALLRQSGE